MKFLNHNLFTGDITVNGTTTLSTATGITRATGDNSTHLATTEFVKAQGYATTAALSGYVPITRTITINGTTLDLSADRAWTISTAGTVRTVYETVKNVSGATILKGTPLAVVTGQTSGNVSDVIPADAAVPTKMPAIFIANENIADEAEGEAVLFGNLTGVNTSAYTSGTTVYVAPGGGWTATKPVWPNKIQNLGIITKQHATNGAGIVTGVGRANDLPNLTAGKIWVGSANYPIESTTVHVDEANGRVGIGTASPSEKLHVVGQAIIDGGVGVASSGTLHIRQKGDAVSDGIAITSSNAISHRIWKDAGGTLNIGPSTLPSALVQTLAGNVGIGTTSPGSPLTVAGAGGSTKGTNGYLVHIGGTDSDIDPVRYMIGFSHANIYTAGNVRAAIGSLITQGGKGNLVFETGAGGAGQAERMRINGDGNVGIGTTSPSYKLQVEGNIASVNTSFAGLFSISGTRSIAAQSFSADWNYLRSNGANFVFGTQDASNLYIRTNDTDRMIVTTAGNVGINTSAADRTLTVFGTTRHERVYGYGNYSFNFSNVGIGETFTWFKLGNATPFSQTKLYYRAGTSTSEEEGEIKISNTCSAPFIEWTRNTYNYHIREVRGVMTGGCGFCEIWVLVRHGNYNLGANTNFQWQIHNGTDSSFVVANATGTPGTGTSQKSINSTDLYFYANSDNMSVAGFVGIGTTNPTVKLQVENNSHNYIQVNSSVANVQTAINVTNSASTSRASLSWEDGTRGAYADLYSSTYLTLTTQSSEKMRITAAGNVGIGTTSPSEKLHVYGNLKVDGQTFMTSGFSSYTTDGLFSASALWNGVITPSGVYRIRLGYLDQGGGQYWGRIGFVANTNWSLGTSQGGNSFSIGTGNGNNEFLIDNAGNVGIGLTSPNTKLHLFGSGDQAITIQSSTTASSASSFVKYIRATTGSARTWWTGVGIQGGTDDGFSFYDETGATERMRISSTGNVGIGTPNPGYKLHVNGDTFFNGSSIVSGNAQVLTINGTNHAYYAWSIANTRKAYAGFGSSGSTTFELINENTGGFIIGTNGGQQIIITSAGNVGIGTTSAATKFVVSNAGASGFEVDPAGGVGGGPVLQAYNRSTSAYMAQSYYALSHTFNVGSGGSTRAIDITAAGNVGIGTTSPARKLDVAGTSIFRDFTTVVSSNGNPVSNTTWLSTDSGITNIYTGGNSTVQLNSNGVSYFNGGNVGIGITVPIEKLHVVGSTHIQSTTNTVGGGGLYFGSSTSRNINLRENTSGDLAIDTYNGTTSWINRVTVLNSSGNVGIGTTSPSSKLHIQTSSGDGLRIITADVATIKMGSTTGGTSHWGFATTNLAASDFGIYQSNSGGGDPITAGAPRLYFNASGNVGIGTTIPGSRLQVTATSNSATTVDNGITILNDSGINNCLAGIRLSTYGDSDGGLYPKQFIGAIRDGDFGAGKGSIVFCNRDAADTSVVALSDEKMRILPNGNVGIGTTSPVTKLNLKESNTGTEGFIITNWNNVNTLLLGSDFATGGGKLTLQTNAGTSNVFISSYSNSYFNGGNVGIGTTSPDARLHVNSDGTLNTQTIVLGIASLSQRPMIQFSEGSAATAGSGMSIEYDGRGSGVSNKMYINDVNSSPVFTVMSGGNVGIGNTDPSQKLHVTGNLRVTGAYYDSNNEAGTSGQILTSTGSGTDWVAPASLYDLLPAARVAYDWTVQMTSGTWADIFSSNTVLSNGTWMVQVYVSDYASGGEQYMETYSGVLSWGSAGGTNAGGANAISEVVLHRSGHSAQAGNFYLRTQERFSSTLLLQGMVNYSHTSNTTINFKFVKVF